jgi:hypothetical protein
MKPVSPKRER